MAIRLLRFAMRSASLRSISALRSFSKRSADAVAGMRLRVLYIRPLAFQAQGTYPKGAYGLIASPALW